MRRIHPHGLNKRCRAHGAADVPSDNKAIVISRGARDPKTTLIIAAQDLTKSLLE
ncbi:hypothetical protein VSR69_07965 [Paraburkholderia phytofirmans]|uniref:hypothetical protein n=1 Tax=Paraburkholderia sp. BL9I2N2 TaxID=1938809 RepID=UPI0014054B0E|nr:hypothetical protein [Paraburkholderia sp. BL9I2N2]